MSTSYYRLKPPITRLQLEQTDFNDVLYVWENGKSAGGLMLSKGSGPAVALMFVVDEYDNACPFFTYYGGAEVGCVVVENGQPLDNTDTVVSEYGDIMTAHQVRSLAGNGRMTNEETKK